MRFVPSKAADFRISLEKCRGFANCRDDPIHAQSYHAISGSLTYGERWSFHTSGSMLLPATIQRAPA